MVSDTKTRSRYSLRVTFGSRPKRSEGPGYSDERTSSARPVRSEKCQQETLVSQANNAADRPNSISGDLYVELRSFVRIRQRSLDLTDSFRTVRRNGDNKAGTSDHHEPRHRTNKLASLPYGRAFGVLVLSFAGHCSESAGKAISLPVIRSTEIA